MKTSTLVLYLAAAGIGGALVARYLARNVTIKRGSLPTCPGDRYTADSSAPSGWRCTERAGAN